MNRAQESQRIRRMMQGRLGTCAEGPDGTLHGFFDEKDVEWDEEGMRRLQRTLVFQLPSDDLGTIAKGSLLTIGTRQFKVWDRPRLENDGLTTLLYLSEAT